MSPRAIEPGRAPGGWADIAPAIAGHADRLCPPGEPFVLFDDARTSAPAILFRNPRRILVAHSLDDIVPALEGLRAGIAQGLYAAGFLAYEAGFAFEPRLAGLHHAGDARPLLWFGLFDKPCSLSLADNGTRSATHLIHATTERSYLDRVTDILSLIEAGDCYQVNFTIEAMLEQAGDPIERYLCLRAAQKAGWGGLLSMGNAGLLSCSPELFFAQDQGTLWTRPMKGTAARGDGPQSDLACIERLRHDPKERAENLMIVDLLRNDMSRVAMPGSVQVEDLFAVETYPTIHQMTSTISARLRSGLDTIDVIRHLFPCGSITGAPKIRAMEIIAAQEQRNRGAYTGSMGFIAPDGRAAFNVLIRTLEYADAHPAMRFGVGSGIVRDSVAGAEWRECASKAAFLAAAANTAQALHQKPLHDLSIAGALLPISHEPMHCPISPRTGVGGNRLLFGQDGT